MSDELRDIDFSEYSVSDSLKTTLRELPPYAALEDVEFLATELGITPGSIIKVDGNENPYGPSDATLRALESLRKIRLHHYGDSDQRRLRSAIADHLSVGFDSVICGNGSDELIDLMFRLFINEGDNIVISSPTFGMYSFDASLHGANVIDVPLSEEWEFDEEGLEKAARDAKLVFIPSPNNPTGNTIPIRLVKKLLKTGAVVVIDEAYIEFSKTTSLAAWVEKIPNLVVLRTFSKWGGLAGLRIGYGVMHPELVNICLQAKQPYNISVIAEAAALAALADSATLDARAEIISAERDRMSAEIAKTEWMTPWPSDASFILFHLDGISGLELRDKLRLQGIFSRYIAHPRLENHLRISIATPDQNDRIISTIKEIEPE
jgi:histidinol-phosphate aminotransferase